MILTLDIRKSVEMLNDNSAKPFEIQRAEYIFLKDTHKIFNTPQWHHFKYYNTYQGAYDAIRDFRNCWQDIKYRDGNGFGRETITIVRYRIVERNIK